MTAIKATTDREPAADFDGHVVAEKLGRRRWRLARPLMFYSRVVGKIVKVPEGFVTDFASVPRLPLTFALFGNRGHAAATVHDWLYQSHPFEERNVADRIFQEALRAEGLRPWRAYAMYLAVHWFGEKPWRTGPDRLRVTTDTTKHCDNCGEVWDPEAEGTETCPDCQPGDIG